MNQGTYREGPSAGGLPLPRARLGALTGAVATFAILATIVPLVVLVVASRHMAGMWMTFKNGGIGMYLLLLLELALPVAVGIAGAVALRGKRVPAGLFFGVAAIPFAASIFFAWLASRVVEGALGGASVDPSTALRIDAEGLSEAMSLDLFGALVACGCALVGAVAAASVVASIDAPAAARARGDAGAPPSSAVLGAATLVTGAAWFVGTIIVTALRIKTVGFLSVFALFVVGTVVPFAVLAARSAPVLRRWHDPLEARRGASALLVAGLCAVFAALAFERAALASVSSLVLGAVSGESIDPSQKARILMELVDARRWSAIAVAVHAILGTATFALALAGAVGRGPPPEGVRHPISPSVVIALSVGVFLFASTLALTAARTRTTEALDARARTNARPGIRLPTIDFEAADWDAAGGRPLLLAADGTVEADTPRLCVGGMRTLVFADRAATIEHLQKALPPFACTGSFDLAATPKSEPPAFAGLGDLAAFARVEYATINATFVSRSFEDARSAGFLGVSSISDDTIEYEGHRVKRAGFADAPDLRASQYGSLRFTVRPDDTIAQVVDTLAGLRKRFGSRIPRAGYFIDVTPRPTARPSGEQASRLRLQTPTVAGRLAPEEVMRVSRASSGTLVACFEEGAKRRPGLAGAVSVRFVIDRSGAVTTAGDAASTLPDRETIACVVRAFRAMRFPQPEAGLVVVTYPMTFAGAQ